MNPFIKYFNKPYLPLTGVLLWMAWPAKTHVTPLIFIAFVPLFTQIISELRTQKPIKYRSIFLHLLVWNLLATWWISNASMVGMVIAVLLNSLLFTLPFIAFKWYSKFNLKLLFYSFFAGFWIAIELFHSSWQFAWPWLNLGNALADFHWIIQWYEYTGIFGGTLWIILVNGLVAELCFENTKRKIAHTALWLFLPIMLSLSIYYQYTEEKQPINITVVQPNVDPYGVKFDVKTLQAQVSTLCTLSKIGISANTELILWPETAFPQNLWEEELNNYSEIDSAWKLVRENPNISLISGASTSRLFKESTRRSIRRFGDGDCCFESYNSAIQFIRPNQYSIYHKSKLVPGVEQIPYEHILGALGDLSLDLGGTTGSLGKQEERTVFFNQQGVGFAPIICYESVFGSYVSDYVKNGAQVLCIITNDGWWKDTDGYVQHFKYAKLRAIESRRSIARAANTGISGFIDQKGNVIKESNWCEKVSINESINLNSTLTFYTKFGDWIAVLSIVFSIAITALYWNKKIL